MLSYDEIVAEVAEHIARDDSHGYSQPNRQGTGGTEAITLSDGTVVKIHTGDYDCSELVRTCVAAAGLIEWGYWDSYMWTGNEDSVLKNAGYVRVDYDPFKLVRGDILWKSGHTGVYLGNLMMADAHGDEYGGINGPKTGDQTGREIEIRSVYSCSWTRAYHYAGPARVGSVSTETPASTQTNEEMISVTPMTVTFTAPYNIRDAAGLGGNVVAMFDTGESVTIDGVVLKDGIVWGHYIGASSGADRYVCIGHLDAVR